ncbi:MAG TPA: ABC transporter permease [Candidatus Acidoferrales bacterium]|nr:ABC transporter permease [Candidatus Acidoferrales bacterium]
MRETTVTQRLAILLLRLAIIGLFVSLWSAISSLGLSFDRLFPSPWAVAATALSLLVEGDFLPHLLFTLYEVAWGFAIGASGGAAVGLALGANRSAGAIFEPIILWLAPVPKIILYPIFLWFLGIGMASRVGMGVASSFFPVAIYAATGVRQVKPVLLEAARLLGAQRRQIVLKVYLPAIVAPLWLGLRLGGAVAFIGILLAETKLSQKGLGFLIIEYYNHFQIAEMYAVLLLVFLIAIAFNLAFSYTQNKVVVLREAQIRKSVG